MRWEEEEELEELEELEEWEGVGGVGTDHAVPWPWGFDTRSLLLGKEPMTFTLNYIS